MTLQISGIFKVLEYSGSTILFTASLRCNMIRKIVSKRKTRSTI